MKLKISYRYFVLLLITAGSCISPFSPDITENKSLLVVEGLVTDLHEQYTVRLSMSVPVGKELFRAPLAGANVTVSDDLGNLFYFSELYPGTYISNPGLFTAVAGRKYKLHVNTSTALTNYHSYESTPMELIPVSPIDSLYYEKVVVKERDEYTGRRIDGAQIYLSSFDPTGRCKYFRWDYVETWEFRLPFEVPNNVCWITQASSDINLKNTSVYSESRVTDYPLSLIDNSTDRLKVRYSTLVNQYSMTQEEFSYWEKLKNLVQDVGGLYDMIPAPVQGNVFCIEDPSEKVLGYFSVSGKSSKRIFIKDQFSGQKDLYRQCITDTIFYTGPIPGEGVYIWVLENHIFSPPIYRTVTNNKGCADCTVRGTNIKPSYW